MARGFNGTSDKIAYTGSGAPGGVYPYTAACRFLLTSTPSTANQNIFNIYSTGGSGIDNIGLSTDHTSGKFNPFITDSAGGADLSIMVGTALAANTWYFGAITGTSSTVRTGYLWQSGSLVSANGDGTTRAITNPGQRYTIGAYTISPPDFPGSVADVAMWNQVLTTTELTALGQGVRPNRVRPGALKMWLPLDGLQSPEPDIAGAAINGVLTGTVLAFGPPMAPFTPRWPSSTQLPPPSQISVSYQRAQQILMTGP